MRWFWQKRKDLLLEERGPVRATAAKARETKAKLDKSRDALIESVCLVLERGENLKALDEKAARLQMSAKSFTSDADKVRSRLKRRSVKYQCIALIFTVVVFVWITGLLFGM